MNKYHVNRSKWYAMSIFEQMGNIYSEIGRTFQSVKLHDNRRTAPAFERALDLFEATAEQLASQKSPRLREVLRAKEIFVSEFLNNIPTSLDSYFMQFAVAARLRQTA